MLVDIDAVGRTKVGFAPGVDGHVQNVCEVAGIECLPGFFGSREVLDFHPDSYFKRLQIEARHSIAEIGYDRIRRIGTEICWLKPGHRYQAPDGTWKAVRALLALHDAEERDGLA